MPVLLHIVFTYISIFLFWCTVSAQFCFPALQTHSKSVGSERFFSSSFCRRREIVLSKVLWIENVFQAKASIQHSLTAEKKYVWKVLGWKFFGINISLSFFFLVRISELFEFWSLELCIFVFTHKTDVFQFSEAVSDKTWGGFALSWIHWKLPQECAFSSCFFRW